jgi:hypothetical protein
MRDEASLRQKRQASHERLWWVAPVAVVALVATAFVSWKLFHPKWQDTRAIVTAGPAAFKQPQRFKDLLALTPEQIERCDIGLMNLLCAEGLPGAENLDVQGCLKKLDGLAKYVQAETQRHAYRFNEHPEQFRDSLGYFRMMMLGTVLVQDLGVQYNPKLAVPQMEGEIPTLGDTANSQDVFIHGLLGENRTGTCASMPVLVVAIGRRLGYPVNLAGAKYHLYVRYEELNGRHFNVEPTVSEGFLTPDDGEYRTGQFAATGEEIQDHSWLRPLSNGEIFSGFLRHRAICLGDAKRYEEAKQMLLLAATFWKETPLRKKSTDYYLQAVREAPMGDRLEAIWNEVGKLDVPNGPRSAYFDNRKVQVDYFLNDNYDLAEAERAANDLKEELAGYREQLSREDPSLARYRQHILRLNLKDGRSVRLPAEVLPPPLNRGSLSPGYIEVVFQMDSDDFNAIVDGIWRYHKQTTLNWMGQAALLPSW